MNAPHTLVLRDGRRLAWEEAGDPHGFAVLFFHGTPGSRLQRRVFFADRQLWDARVRMITWDRPGCGFSDLQIGRRFEDGARDALELLEHLGLTRAALLAFSGGTPYALALAASSASVSGLSIVSADAPPRAVAGVSGGPAAPAAARPAGIALMLRAISALARVAPGLTATLGTRLLVPPDRAVVGRPEIRRSYVSMLRDALRQGPRGVLVDWQLADRAWQVLPPRQSVPIQIWQGEADEGVPVSIARYFATRLPDARVHTLPSEGHVSVLVHYAHAILQSLVASVEPPVQVAESGA